MATETIERRDLRQWVERAAGPAFALGLAMIIALAVGAVIILLYGEQPGNVYGAIISFAFKSPTDFGQVLAIATPLIFSALAVAVCFKGGMFNIGVEGQYLVAMVTASIGALNFGFLPAPLHVVVVLLFAMVGGMIWAAIPGVLKVATGAHEVVTTIMLNGASVSLVAWALNHPLHYNDAPPGFNVDLRTNIFPKSALMPDIGGPFGIGPSAHFSLLFPLALVAATVVWFFVKRMRLGYEARAVGSSAGSAQAGGIGIGAVQIKLFLLSGALAGLVGMQQILADKGYFPQNYEAQLGFTGIAVAFLGQNNPIGIVFAAVLWGILSRGESALQIETDVPREFIIILQGILILAVVVTYQIAKRRLERRSLQREGVVEGLAGDEETKPREEEAHAAR